MNGASLSWDNAGAGQDVLLLGHILHAQANQIASTQLASDSKAENGRVTQLLAQLQPHADHSDLLQLQRRVLPNQVCLYSTAHGR